jgi:SAM-dependent methyltransferase
MQREYYAEYFQVEGRHWWFVGRKAIFLRVLDRCFASSTDGARRRVLDVGCGTGTMIQHLSRYGRAEGVDADADAVRFCRERGVERVRQIDGLRLPFEEGTFQLVTALDVLEHLDDDLAMLREMRRVLEPGGVALVSVPAYRLLWGPQDEISAHKRRYRARELRERLIGAGFEVQRLSYFNTLLFPPIAAIRVLRRPFRRSAELRSDFQMTKSPALNELLGRVFSFEAPIVERVDLPFGVSILGLASKPTGTTG